MRPPASTSALHELDRIAVRIFDPRGAELAVEKIVGRRQHGRAAGGERAERRVGAVGPQHDLDAAAAVMLAAVAAFVIGHIADVDLGFSRGEIRASALGGEAVIAALLFVGVRPRRGE